MSLEEIAAAYATFERDLPRVWANDPRVTELNVWLGTWEPIANMTAEDWEQLGSAISNNTHLKSIFFSGGVFGNIRNGVDYEKLSSFFRGLTGSNTINTVSMMTNGFGVQGVQYMAPFIENASSLAYLDISSNNIGSEGFNLLWRALCDSQIKVLNCRNCGIDSIEIDINHVPKSWPVTT